MQVVFIYKKPISSFLTKLFTKSGCYHVGMTDGVKFWDMHKINRRRNWAGLYPADRVILVDTPVPVSAAYMDNELDTSEETYSFWDYAAFAVRWLYHLCGKSTRNYGGLICSEKIAIDLIKNGWDYKFPNDEVPSPADLELALLGRINAIES